VVQEQMIVMVEQSIVLAMFLLKWLHSPVPALLDARHGHQ
jgi:hypothetical protein